MGFFPSSDPVLFKPDTFAHFKVQSFENQAVKFPLRNKFRENCDDVPVETKTFISTLSLTLTLLIP